MNYMTQNAFMVTNQTSRIGSYVRRENTVSDVVDILSGKLDDLEPERMLYISTIAEAGK